MVARRHGRGALDLDDDPDQLRNLPGEEGLVAEAVPPQEHGAGLRANDNLLHENGGDHIKEPQDDEDHDQGVDDPVAPTVTCRHKHEDRLAIEVVAIAGDGTPEDGEEALAYGAEVTLAGGVVLGDVAEGLTKDDGRGVQREEEDDQGHAQHAEPAEQALHQDRQLLEYLQPDDPRDPRRPQRPECPQHGVEAAVRALRDEPLHGNLHEGDHDDGELHQVPTHLLARDEERAGADAPTLRAELGKKDCGEDRVDDQPAVPARRHIAADADTDGVQDHQDTGDRVPTEYAPECGPRRGPLGLGHRQVLVELDRLQPPHLAQALGENDGLRASGGHAPDLARFFRQRACVARSAPHDR
mmetsp:Transcript_34586/g.100294  ORF Transcript_34586/g.100294 Transcript_34586/m.100294 type:complete len:356 (+) Transcript_34586:536-1603(+)